MYALYDKDDNIVKVQQKGLKKKKKSVPAKTTGNIITLFIFDGIKYQLHVNTFSSDIYMESDISLQLRQMILSKTNV